MVYNSNEILNKLNQFTILKEPAFYENNIDNITKEAKSIFGKDTCTFSFGATKFVIIPNNADYVIKIPFTGWIEEEYDKDDYLIGETYRDYEGANNKDNDWDYCATEVERYQSIEDSEFVNCFAKPIRIGFVYHHPIYIQEKCTIFSYTDNVDSHSFAERDSLKESCREKGISYPPMNIDWLIDFVNFFGEDLMYKFLLLLSDNAWDDDLRGENIGYIGKRPVLIDFSGFNE